MTFVDISPLETDLVNDSLRVQFQYKGSHLHLLLEFPESLPREALTQQVEEALIRCHLPGIRYVLIYGRPRSTTTIKWRLGYWVRIASPGVTQGLIRTFPVEQLEQTSRDRDDVPTEIKILELPSTAWGAHPRSRQSRLRIEDPTSRRRRRKRRGWMGWAQRVKQWLGPVSPQLLLKVLGAGALSLMITLALWKGFELVEQYNQGFLFQLRRLHESSR